jgi:hypothetical protein
MRVVQLNMYRYKGGSSETVHAVIDQDQGGLDVESPRLLRPFLRSRSSATFHTEENGD